MAKKGAPTKQKRLSVSPIRQLPRKEYTWTIRQDTGPHTQETSIPLGFLVRDMFQLARTSREAKRVLNQGHIHVDGRVRKSSRFAVGLFDTISIAPTKKNYRLLLDSKGRLVPKEISETIVGQKPAKVVSKNWTKAKKLLFQTHDGKTFPNLENTIRVGDSLLVSTAGKDVKNHLPLAKGAHVLITGGIHVGEVATITGIIEGTMKRKKLVDLVEGKENFQTTAQNVMVIDAPTMDWIKQNMDGGTKP